ncbi:hypothetical protein BESB_067160 [Besnoitia besnoiti]|uniref:Uncharacterized protein n=1 Tax=Besnoitia besnoiti TaxID=94643 RepID=A0A2A9MGA5_BESBE|nr:hypothetical protein BESB_067160 [Besnoitia besnoiti]PFH34683.1 hypothetical protein BESB_067160 [Besnoitia besnoiti]
MPRKRWGLEIAASDERWVESLPSLGEVGDKRRKLLGHEQGEHRYAESIEEKSKREALSPSCATAFSDYTVLPSESAYCSRPSRFPSPRTHLKAPKSSSNGQIAEPRSLVGPLSSLKQPLFADRLHNALVTGRERAGDAGTNLGNPNCAIYAAGQPPSPRDRATVCSAPRPVVEEPLSDDEDSVVARENALSGRSRAGLTTRVSSSSENHGWSSASLGGESARAGRAISFESHAAFWNSREVCIFRVRQSPVDKYNPTEPGWKNGEATSLNTEKASGLERQTPADRRWSAQGGEITPARIDEPSSSDEE